MRTKLLIVVASMVAGTFAGAAPAKAPPAWFAPISAYYDYNPKITPTYDFAALYSGRIAQPSTGHATKAQPAVSASTHFQWGAAGAGAATMLGIVLAAVGIVALQKRRSQAPALQSPGGIKRGRRIRGGANREPSAAGVRQSTE
jgi:hypothetical protein